MTEGLPVVEAVSSSSTHSMKNQIEAAFRGGARARSQSSDRRVERCDHARRSDSALMILSGRVTEPAGNPDLLASSQTA